MSFLQMMSVVNQSIYIIIDHFYAIAYAYFGNFSWELAEIEERTLIDSCLLQHIFKTVSVDTAGKLFL
jgi:hypothetical protein